MQAAGGLRINEVDKRPHRLPGLEDVRKARGGRLGNEDICGSSRRHGSNDTENPFHEEPLRLAPRGGPLQLRRVDNPWGAFGENLFPVHRFFFLFSPDFLVGPFPTPAALGLG